MGGDARRDRTLSVHRVGTERVVDPCRSRGRRRCGGRPSSRSRPGAIPVASFTPIAAAEPKNDASPKREHATVARDQPVAAHVTASPRFRRRRADAELGDRTKERGVTEREHATVTRDEPVARTVGRGRDAHDRLVQVRASWPNRRTPRRRTRTRHRRGRRASSRRWSASPRCRRSADSASSNRSSRRSRVAEREHTTVFGRDPVAVARSRGRDRWRTGRAGVHRARAE